MNKIKPYYHSHIFVCQNERPEGHPRGCCARKGSIQLFNYMKAQVKKANVKAGQVRVNKAGCLDRCEEGPSIVIYPEGVWYKITCPQDVDLIVDQHLIGGQVVTSLLLPERE